GVGLARILSRHRAWAECSRQLGPLLGALASVMLLVVLGQEAALYDWHEGRTPMALWSILIVALALAGLIAAGVAFVLQPQRDPFGLSEEGRTLYVYAGELLLVLLFVHFRLTVPELFRLEILARYWTFIVMGI